MPEKEWAIQEAATRRVALKRFLRRKGFPFPVNTTDEATLRAWVGFVGGDADTLIRENFDRMAQEQYDRERADDERRAEPMYWRRIDRTAEDAWRGVCSVFSTGSRFYR